MKKYFFMMLLTACCMSVNAQMTFNVRAGAGAIGTKHDETGLGFNAQFQGNIPFQKGSPWTFSPAVAIGVQLDDDDAMQVYAPLQVGYKVPMGQSSMFFPKFGAALGYEAEAECAIAGPSVSLDFEIKHFVIGLNGFYSLTKAKREYYRSVSYGNTGYAWYETEKSAIFGAFINFGYKF